MCYLCSMKRKMIWVLTAIIVLLSAVLLYMQWRNAELMVKMRKEQFDERACFAVSTRLPMTWSATRLSVTWKPLSATTRRSFTA